MANQIGFERIVYFGDSLTDSGAFFQASEAVAFFGVPPALAGYAGQFSNGDVYADYVPGLIGIEDADNLNLAVGGAQLLTDRTIGELLAGTGLIRPDADPADLAFGVDYGAQVDRFLGTGGEEPAPEIAPSALLEDGADLSGAAASIFIGLNDYNDFIPTSLETAGAEAFAYGVLLANRLIEQSAPLVDAGVGTFILHTNPLVTVFPSTNGAGPGEELLFQAVDAGFNGALRARADELGANGADVIIIEMGAIFAEVDADPKTFGFQIFEEQVLLGDNGSGGINPAIFGFDLDQIGFFDSVHPTAAFHGILGAFEAESLTSDVTIGTGEDERIVGSRADDLVLASGGDDIVLVGRGADVVLAGIGDDLVAGGKGADLIASGAGDDIVFGGRGRDIIADGAGDDRAQGGLGRDLFIDGEGSDLYFGQRGRDTFVFTDEALLGPQIIPEIEGPQAAFLGEGPSEQNVVFGGKGQDTLILRVADAEADLGVEWSGDRVTVDALGITAFNVENVIVVEGRDLSEETFYSDQLATADLWNFV